MIKVIESECRCSICGNYSARLYCVDCAKKAGKKRHYERVRRKFNKEKKTWGKIGMKSAVNSVSNPT
jgi:hypothetical protein